MSRAKHLHVRHEQRLAKYVKQVKHLADEADARTKKLKKKKGIEHWYEVRAVTVPGDCFTYPRLEVIYRRVKTER